MMDEGMSEQDQVVEIKLELRDEEALAFAEFLKRVYPEDFERRAGDKIEARLMWDAGLAIKVALAEKGYAPR